jgi:hypothetical protein
LSEFFGRLELELRAAAARPPRRTPGWAVATRAGVGALAVASLLAVALVPAVLLVGRGDRGNGGDRVGAEEPRSEVLPPVGTVIPKGTGTPLRESDSTVLATGIAPVAGPWQLEHYRGTGVTDPDTGEVYEPAGLPCLLFVPVDPPEGTLGATGQCGSFPRTPGFGRLQSPVYTSLGGEVKEVLVYGRAPERAAAVELTADGGFRKVVDTYEGPNRVKGDTYLIVAPPDIENGRVNWIDRDGNPGSRGIQLIYDTKGRLR